MFMDVPLDVGDVGLDDAPVDAPLRLHSAAKQKVTAVEVTSSRIVPGAAFWEREYTLYFFVSTITGAAPLTFERRFSEVVRFHDEFVKPVMSFDRPIMLPSDLQPGDFVMKNDEKVVTSRRVSLRHWANSCLEMSNRLGSPQFDSALQLFLRGGDTDMCALPFPEVWDPAGEWVFNTKVKFNGDEFVVPHTLLLSPDGKNAFFVADGHPLGGGCVCRGAGTYETVENGAAIRVTMDVEVHTAKESTAGDTAGVGSSAPAESAALDMSLEVTSRPPSKPCTMLLRKQFRPLASSLDDLKKANSVLTSLGDRVDTLFNGGEGTNEQRQLVRAQCKLDGQEVACGMDSAAVALASNGGMDVAWLPGFFDKEIPMSLSTKVALGGAGVIGLIIII